MHNREPNDPPRRVPPSVDLDEEAIERRIEAIPDSLDARQRMAAILEADPSVDPDMLLITFYDCGELPGDEQIAFERRIWTDHAFRKRVKFVDWMLSLPSEGDDPGQHRKSSGAQRARRARVGDVKSRRLTHAAIAARMKLPIAAVGWHMCKGNEELEQLMKPYLAGEELPPDIAAELRKGQT